ncbi:MAG: hypothetical protein P8Y45_20155 [Exilibacterium sp.]
MTKKDELIQALQEYANNPECGLTHRQVDNVRKQLHRELRQRPIQNAAPPIDVKPGREAWYILALALAILVRELCAWL